MVQIIVLAIFTELPASVPERVLRALVALSPAGYGVLPSPLTAPGAGLLFIPAGILWATAHWGFEDPAAFVGAHEAKAKRFNEVYWQIMTRVRSLANLPIERLVAYYGVEGAGVHLPYSWGSPAADV